MYREYMMVGISAHCEQYSNQAQTLWAHGSQLLARNHNGVRACSCKIRSHSFMLLTRYVALFRDHWLTPTPNNQQNNCHIGPQILRIDLRSFLENFDEWGGHHVYPMLSSIKNLWGVVEWSLDPARINIRGECSVGIWTAIERYSSTSLQWFSDHF